MMPKPKKLLDQVRDRIRTKQYSFKTEQAYLNWIKRYILFHDKRRPKELTAEDLETYLTYLAAEGKAAVSNSMYSVIVCTRGCSKNIQTVA